MSIVAWDGKTVAADRCGTSCGHKFMFKKIHRYDEGLVMATCGYQSSGAAMVDWYLNGRDKEKFPGIQLSDSWSYLIVFDKNIGVFYYDRSPHPVNIDEPFFAWGSGRDFALGAMEMGADAVKAVEVASKFSDTCGLGIDRFDVVDYGKLKEIKAPVDSDQGDDSGVIVIRGRSISLK